jgi:hypothetical protein
MNGRWKLKKTLAALAMLMAAPALAQDAVSFEVDNFFVDSGITTAVLAVTNNLETPVTSVFLSCAFLNDEEKAIDVGGGLISRLDAGETAYERVSIGTGDGVQYARCRVEKYQD